MFWTIFWLCNIPFYFYTAYRIAGQFAWHEKNQWSWNKHLAKPSGGDIAIGWVIGLFLGFLWPFVLLVSLGANTDWMLYTPKDEKLKLAQRRIQELEREVGIR